MEQYSANGIDRIDNFISDIINSLSDKVIEVSNRVINNANSSLVRGGARLVGFGASLANETEAAIVVERLTSKTQFRRCKRYFPRTRGGNCWSLDVEFYDL